jgi:hypothetical protein
MLQGNHLILIYIVIKAVMGLLYFGYAYLVISQYEGDSGNHGNSVDQHILVMHEISYDIFHAKCPSGLCDVW